MFTKNTYKKLGKRIGSYSNKAHQLHIRIIALVQANAIGHANEGTVAKTKLLMLQDSQKS